MDKQKQMELAQALNNKTLSGVLSKALARNKDKDVAAIFSDLSECYVTNVGNIEVKLADDTRASLSPTGTFSIKPPYQQRQSVVPQGTAA